MVLQLASPVASSSRSLVPCGAARRVPGYRLAGSAATSHNLLGRSSECRFASPQQQQRVPRRDCRNRSAAVEAEEAKPSEKSAEKWWNRDTAENMRDVANVQELVDILADAGDKLVIVEFYAPWCNACKALYPKICKIMKEHIDDVLFVKVSFEDNKDMCKNMGVKVLPYFQFFRGAEGKVDQFSCTVSKIQKFRDAIYDYSGAFCSLEEPPGVPEFPEVHPSGEHHHPDADTITKLAWN